MKSKFWQLLFIAVAIAYMLSAYFQWNEVGFVTKPLLTIILIIYSFAEVNGKNKIFFLLLPALFFSCCGDIFLLLENKSPAWFMFGLSSFLIAHIFYINLFIQIKKANQPYKKLNAVVSVIICAYTICLFLLLKPALGDLKIPVLIYAAALSVMLLTSLHAFDLSKQTAGKLCASGAILFLISDSLLAINKFYTPIAKAGLLVMGTYASAQLLIVIGTVKYINSASDN